MLRPERCYSPVHQPVSVAGRPKLSLSADLRCAWLVTAWGRPGRPFVLACPAIALRRPLMSPTSPAMVPFCRRCLRATRSPFE
jgi:hypothetical protein